MSARKTNCQNSGRLRQWPKELTLAVLLFTLTFQAMFAKGFMPGTSLDQLVTLCTRDGASLQLLQLSSGQAEDIEQHASDMLQQDCAFCAFLEAGYLQQGVFSPFQLTRRFLTTRSPTPPLAKTHTLFHSRAPPFV